MKFIYPTDGDMLTNAAGRLIDGQLCIEAAVQSEQEVFIQGIKAQKDEDGLWKAQVMLCGDRTILKARSGAEEIEIAVYHLPNADKKYALSVDDNIWWLAELTMFPRDSIFDHPYLAVYKRAHKKYGAKVRFNLFYQVDDYGRRKCGAFDLSQMTDRYKAEFEENSDWMHLAFHSLWESSEDPKNPSSYENSSYEKVMEDWQKVRREIIRFAGEKSLEHATTIHCGRCTPEGISALYDGGIRVLMGFMSLDRQGKPSVSYNLSVQRVLDTQRYGFWKDEQSGMIYGKIDVVMNSHSPERIRQILDREHREHPMRGFCEIMIHEQYFHQDYFNYESDYEERILAGCRWCTERGYQGVFVEEVI